MVDEKEIENEEEEVIDEDELEDLLEEVKGEPEKESEETSEGEGEIEIELEPETQEEEEKAEIEEKELIEGEVKPEAIQPVTAPTIQPQSGLVEPVCSIEKAIEIFKKFEEAKRKILSENDIMWIGDDGRPTAKGQGTPYIKRSGWRKLARFFGLSWDVESVNKTKMENGGYMYRARVKVWHPSGASVTAEGAATSEDKFFTKGGRKEADEADVLMKAETVAINRVISDILGCGEVSEEETE